MSKKAPDVYFEKTDDEKKRLRGVLKANWLCSHLDEEQAVTVINMEKVTFESGEDIIKQETWWQTTTLFWTRARPKC